MYKRVEAQMILAGVSKRQLAKEMGVSYNTLIEKLKGKRNFSLDEATKIKKILNTEDTIENLFCKTA